MAGSSKAVASDDLLLPGVTVCDMNAEMLAVGRERGKHLDFDDKKLRWVQGDAHKLPFDDGSFDAFTISFGIRNCTDVDRVLAEAFRVLKKGGRFMCLEFSHVTNPILSELYDQYSFQVIPVLGEVLAADWDSYQYLVESIRQFPDQSEVCWMMEDAGFSHVTYENLSCGIAAIHSGFKL